MDVEGVDHDEDDTDEGAEEQVDADLDELFDVGADLLQLAEGFAGALVLEDLVGEGQGVADAVGVHLGTELLGDAADDVVLEILGDAGDEGDADGGAQEERDAAEELLGCVLLVLGGVVVDDVAEDEGVEEGEDLIDGGEEEGEEDLGEVLLQIAIKDRHGVLLMMPEAVGGCAA